jgi:hypothetical protein
MCIVVIKYIKSDQVFQKSFLDDIEVAQKWFLHSYRSPSYRPPSIPQQTLSTTLKLGKIKRSDKQNINKRVVRNSR